MPRTPEAVRRAGAHFLPRDSPWVRRIVEEAALRPGESVLDAGAGTGSLTAAAAAAVQPGGTVLAVEADPDAAAALRRLGLAGVRVVEGDVLKVRWPRPLGALVANPPFRILPALLRRLVRHGFGRAVLVMPQELADRLVAGPGTAAYGRLTVEVGLGARCKVLAQMPRRAFDPPPGVACGLVHVRPREGSTPLDEKEEGAWTAVLDAAWAAPRRTLRHSLAPVAEALGVPPQAVSGAVAAVNGAGRTAAQVAPWEYRELVAALARHLPRMGPQGS